MKPKHEAMFMRIAEAVALTSSATRAKVGAVVQKDLRVLSSGYNGLASCVDGPCEDDQGNTRLEVRHAERNALMGLTRTHESSVGATMFCTLSCCKQCAYDIIDAGISEFLFRDYYHDTSGIELLKQAGVKVRKFKEVL